MVLLGTELTVREQITYGPVVGLRIWDSGVALAKFLRWWCAEGHPLEGRAALELGAGTGIVGLVLADLGAEVTLTDFEPGVLQLLQQNIDENDLGARAFVKHLDWCDPASYLPHGPPTASGPAKTGHFDLIVAGDVVYDIEVERDLALAFAAHVHMGSDTEALLAFKQRKKLSDGRDLFLMLLGLGFRMERLEDATGQALGSGAEEASRIFRDGRFVALPQDAEAAAAALLSARFDDSGDSQVQIVRLTRPDFGYYVIGSWTDWKTWGEMRRREGSPTCRRTVPVRGGRVEEFQIGIDRDWKRVFYPGEAQGDAIEAAGPGEAHGINWSVRVPEGAAFCEVLVDINAPPRRRVSWQVLERPPLWEVASGLGRGGVLVRISRKLTSKELGRLSEGSVVEELEVRENRLKYGRLLEGEGPSKGWVSLDFQGKELMRRRPPSCAGSRR